MREFMGQDFLLTTETAKKLYHTYAAKMPIFDFHNHLNPREIYEDKVYENIAEVWLGGDHYKWRAMRTYGIAEEKITGTQGDPYEKFLAWADTVDHAPGNPLYHWTHLELQQYFGISTPLDKESAEEIWDACNEKLHTKNYSVRNLLRMQKVKALCTTDDPCDDLIWHRKLAEEGFEIKVLPSFRPDQVVYIDKEGFRAYIKQLSDSSEIEIGSLDQLQEALVKRLDYFKACGCCISDHSLENTFDGNVDKKQAEKVLRKRLRGDSVTAVEASWFKGYLLCFLGREYCKRDIVMQLHIGALRNNSTRMYQALGADTGFDSMHDFPVAEQISKLLDVMDKVGELPKTILYNLNPKDSAVLACMTGNYQGESIKGKVQFGPAWWFCDHKRGIEEHFDILASLSLVSVSVGMLTDSRSFLSFPRHEYFRRIWCSKIGELIEGGEYPANLEKIGHMLKDICYHNAVTYFRI